MHKFSQLGVGVRCIKLEGIQDATINIVHRHCQVGHGGLG
jgi:hypothetical protein